MSVYGEKSSDVGFLYFKKSGEKIPQVIEREVVGNEKAHRGWEFVFVEKGCFSFDDDGEEVRALAGDVVFFGKFEQRFYDFNGDFEGYILIVDEWYLQVFSSIYENKRFSRLLSDKTANRKIFKQIRLWHSNFKRVLFSVFNQVNAMLAALCENYKLSEEKASKNDLLIYKMLSYVERNYKENVSLKELAKSLGYAKEYCSLVFNRALGINFRAYLNRIRIKKFSETVSSEKSDKNKNVLEIAYDCGFESSSTFYRAYNDFYGKNPVRKKSAEKKSPRKNTDESEK